MSKLTEASSLARLLMHQHGVGHLQFGFTSSKNTLGRCVFRREVGSSHYMAFKITLSREFIMINTIEATRDVILHEIAHALAGHSAGHGPEWQRIARRIGARPERCATRATTEMPLCKYNAICPSCSLTEPIGGRTKFPLTDRMYTCPKHGIEVTWRFAYEIAAARRAAKLLEES